MGLEAAVQLAGHLLDKHARVAELDGAQHGLELVLLDQLLGRLVPLVDQSEDGEHALACERVGVTQPPHEGTHKGRVAELGHDAAEGAVDGR